MSISHCADENGICNLPSGTQNIIYTTGHPSMISQNNGHTGSVKSHFRTISNDNCDNNCNSYITCNNDTFGNLKHNAPKRCYIRNAPSYTTDTNGYPNGYIKCADENHTCYSIHGADVLYGADGKYVSGLIAPNQSIKCNNNVFGDPGTNGKKACYIKPISINQLAPQSTSYKTPDSVQFIGIPVIPVQIQPMQPQLSPSYISSPTSPSYISSPTSPSPYSPYSPQTIPMSSYSPYSPQSQVNVQPNFDTYADDGVGQYLLVEDVFGNRTIIYK